MFLKSLIACRWWINKFIFNQPWVWWLWLNGYNLQRAQNCINIRSTWAIFPKDLFCKEECALNKCFTQLLCGHNFIFIVYIMSSKLVLKISVVVWMGMISKSCSAYFPLVMSGQPYSTTNNIHDVSSTSFSSGKTLQFCREKCYDPSQVPL